MTNPSSISPGFLATIYNDNLFERIWDITQRVELLNLLFSPKSCDMQPEYSISPILHIILHIFLRIFFLYYTRVGFEAQLGFFMECSLLTNVRPDAVTKRRDSCPSVSPCAACRSVQDVSFFSGFVLLPRCITAPAFIPFALKRLLYAANFFAGTFTTAFAYVPVNACAPTFLLVSESVLIVMERSFLQL